MTHGVLHVSARALALAASLALAAPAAAALPVAGPLDVAQAASASNLVAPAAARQSSYRHGRHVRLAQAPRRHVHHYVWRRKARPSAGYGYGYAYVYPYGYSCYPYYPYDYTYDAACDYGYDYAYPGYYGGGHRRRPSGFASRGGRVVGSPSSGAFTSRIDPGAGSGARLAAGPSGGFVGHAGGGFAGGFGGGGSFRH